jgi:hypothetical protein
MPQLSSERFELGQSYPKPSTPHEGQRSFAPAEPRPLLPLAEDHKHGVQNWLMRPHNQRVDRKSLPSITIAPKPRPLSTTAPMAMRLFDYILTLSNGSRSQLISDRFSRMISARRSMSA